PVPPVNRSECGMQGACIFAWRGMPTTMSAKAWQGGVLPSSHRKVHPFKRKIPRLLAIPAYMAQQVENSLLRVQRVNALLCVTRGPLRSLKGPGITAVNI